MRVDAKLSSRADPPSDHATDDKYYSGLKCIDDNTDHPAAHTNADVRIAMRGPENKRAG